MSPRAARLSPASHSATPLDSEIFAAISSTENNKKHSNRRRLVLFLGYKKPLKIRYKGEFFFGGIKRNTEKYTRFLSKLLIPSNRIKGNYSFFFKVFSLCCASTFFFLSFFFLIFENNQTKF
ncbi:hypothetical protein V6Z11_A08G283500 [Gossypium hirsutum]